jgi:hypothetical protein
MTYCAITEGARGGSEIWAVVEPSTLSSVWKESLLRIAKRLSEGRRLSVVWADARLWSYLHSPQNPYPGVISGPFNVPWRYRRGGGLLEIEIHSDLAWRPTWDQLAWERQQASDVTILPESMVTRRCLCHLDNALVCSQYRSPPAPAYGFCGTCGHNRECHGQ